MHRSERMGAERCRNRTELMTVNQWKLERSLENDNPINLFFTGILQLNRVEGYHYVWGKYYPGERKVVT